ncbi:MAG TPA: hypothetical protein P5543_11120 [Planctomycetota bacterium]|nr:hypothetical protein [Planctomycetota bacterium]HRU52727.1 hypothetical protein [Planctomycetota bacterium]
MCVLLALGRQTCSVALERQCCSGKENVSRGVALGSCLGSGMLLWGEKVARKWEMLLWGGEIKCVKCMNTRSANLLWEGNLLWGGSITCSE